MVNKQAVLAVILISFLGGNIFGASHFDQCKLDYLQTEGTDYRMFYARIWPYLEKMRMGQMSGNEIREDVDGVNKTVKQIVHNAIQCWANPWNIDDVPPYGFAWKWAAWQEHLILCWVRYRYGDVIDPADRYYIDNIFDSMARSRDISPGSANTQIADIVARYLYCQDHPDIRIHYYYDPPPNQNINTFAWGGTTYIPGDEYNALQFTRDWLNYRFDYWLSQGYTEFDSPIYTWTFIHAFTTLYEFAKDPLMKRKAKIMTDFMILESVLDFTGQQWGGAMGRFYEKTITQGMESFYWNVFWDKIRSSHDPSYALVFGSYRLPDAIVDIGDLSDEPDNYYHINKEFNAGIARTGNTGKWTYVTKFYSLGGARGGGWQLVIGSTDEPGSYNHPGVPFRLWLDNNNIEENVSTSSDYHIYLNIGINGFQYRNAMFARACYLHYGLRYNSFDEDIPAGSWRFLREGRTMIAVKCRTDRGVGAVEVAIEGVDYPDMNAFINAIYANANVNHNSYVTSRGDVIGYTMMEEIPDLGATIQLAGESNWHYVWDFPFPRIETIDYLGNYIVQWQGDQMIVTKHGRRLIYDFDNWTVDETAPPPDTTPPDPPYQNPVVQTG